MTQTFTTSQPITEKSTQKEINRKEQANNEYVPSERVIQNILNYSKNLEVHPSEAVKNGFEYLKS